MGKSLFGKSFANISKRIKISHAQKMTLVEVGITSLVLGASIMLMIFLGKYINLNTQAIGAKGRAIENYAKTIANVGICLDNNKDGMVKDEELNKCHPNDLTLDQTPNTLRSEIMTNIATNKALESVARDNMAEACLNSDRKPIDFLKRYKEATNDTDKAKALELLKSCSALRVIPDALPAQQNVEGTIASANWLLNQARVSAESLSPSENASSTSSSAADAIPVSIVLSTGTQDVYRALFTIERSIRTFDVNTLSIEWGGGNSNLGFTIKANAYYSGQTGVKEFNQTVTTKGVRKGNR